MALITGNSFSRVYKAQTPVEARRNDFSIWNPFFFFHHFTYLYSLSIKRGLICLYRPLPVCYMYKLKWIWRSHGVIVKSTVFWVVKIVLQLRETQRLSSPQVSAWFCWFLAWNTLQPWRWRQYVPAKPRAFSELRGVTTHKFSVYNKLLLENMNKRGTMSYYWGV
jgi:hypothetical protein